MGHPYRSSPPAPLKEEEKVRTYDFDLSDITVEVTWHNRLGDICTALIEFQGDENKHEGSIVKVSRRYGRPPSLSSGKAKFDEFLHYGHNRGYVYINDYVVPWDRIFQFKIVKKVERSAKVKWHYEEDDRP